MLKSVLLLCSAFFSAAMGCATPACVFANPNMRFGNGAQNSVNNQGLFEQPFYYSYIANQWYRLTFANYPLDTAIGTGTGTAHWSGANVVDLYTLTPTSSTTDYSQYVTTSVTPSTTVGYGTIVASRTYTVNGQNIVFTNKFVLGPTSNFVKVVTKITNADTATVNNANIWVGTRDDFVGNTDVNVKTRGNVANGNFTAITSSTDESRAIMITNPSEGILFYSDSPGVKTAYSWCCAFSNTYDLDPSTVAPSTVSGTDGSYAIVLNVGNIGVGNYSSITWYYAAGAISTLSEVVESVSEAQQAESSADQTPSVTRSESATATGTPTQTKTQTGSRTSTKTSTPSNTETPTNTVSPSETETATGTETSSQSESETSTGTETSSQSETGTSTDTGTSSQSETATETSTPTKTSSKTITPSRSSNATMSMEIFPTFLMRSKTPFFTELAAPVVEDKTKYYSTVGIVLGTLGVFGGLGIAIMVILNIARNLKKPENKRRQSMDSSSQISRQTSAQSESTRRPSVTTEESEASRRSSISRSDRADSDSSGSKEVIDMGVSSALSPKPQRNDNDGDFSLIKVSKDELNEVMSILRQRNKSVSVYK